MKNNSFVTIILIACILGWGTVLYQNKLQVDSEKRMEEVVISRLDEKRTIEESIKKEIEKKRRDQQIVSLIEQGRELEDSIAARLSEYEDSNLLFKEELDKTVKTRLDEYSVLQSQYKEQLEHCMKEVQGYVKKLEESSESAVLDKESFLKSINELKSIVEKQDNECRQRILKYEGQLNQLEDRLDKYSLEHKKLEEEFTEYKKQHSLENR